MENISLMVTIVKKGWGDKILESSMKAGAEGGTIFLGRGTGIHEKQTLMGIPIEPEKEIVFSVLYQDKKDAVMDAIVDCCHLESPGVGIAFILPVEKVVGISHRHTNPE